jgi:drug/metabolite transporter (DMT)-like permease
VASSFAHFGVGERIKLKFYFLIKIYSLFFRSGIASVIVASTPIVTALVAHFVLADERLTLLKSIGFLFGLSGLILVSLQGSKRNRVLIVDICVFRFSFFASLTKKTKKN